MSLRAVVFIPREVLEPAAGEETQAAREHLDECIKTLQEAAIQLAAGEADDARRALLVHTVTQTSQGG